MTANANRWVRLVRAADALWLAKVLVAALAFWLLRASPAYALGAVFALPLLLAAVAYIARTLYVAATGHEPRSAPPVRLGRPLWERRPPGDGERADWAPTSRGARLGAASRRPVRASRPGE